MKNFLIMSAIVTVAFMAGRLLARIRKRSDEMTRNITLAIASLAFSVWMAIRGVTLGWTIATSVLAALGLLNVISKVAAIRRHLSRRARGY